MAKKNVEELAAQEAELKATQEAEEAAKATEQASGSTEGDVDANTGNNEGDAPVVETQAGYATAQAFAEFLATVQDENLSTAYVIEQLNLITAYKVPSTSNGVTQRRGVLAGKALADMTDEELKRETINSKSVLYKAKDRGASADTIAKNQARVDAVEAEKKSRTGAAAPVGETPVDPSVETSADPAVEVVTDPVVVTEDQPSGDTEATV